LPSCGNLSTSCLATPCAQGTNASSLAAVALSLASGFNAGGSLGQGRCRPTIGNALPSSCAVTSGSSTSPASAISTPAGLRVSRPP
jgi:hypothetical protein